VVQPWVGPGLAFVYQWASSTDGLRMFGGELEKFVRYTFCKAPQGDRYVPLQGKRHPPPTATSVTGSASVPTEAESLTSSLPRICTSSDLIVAWFSMQRSPRT
jgi:hypothetical protein